MSWIPAECYGWELWAIEEWDKAKWTQYGLRVNISQEWLDVAMSYASEYLYYKFWRSKYASQIAFGPLNVRELPYEDWEKEFEIPGMKRFQILHYGRKGRSACD